MATKTTKTAAPVTPAGGRPPSQQIAGPLPPTPAERRARLMAADPVEARPVSEVSTEAPRSAEPSPDDTLPSGRARGWKVKAHVPLRPETVEQEKAHYSERIKAWEQAKARWEERQASDYITEDIAHRIACEVRQACPHPAHVRRRRELHEETVHDKRHLGACEKEEDACLDASHLLPPHPVDVRLEFCCPSRCFPLGDVRSLTECLSVPPQVRARRQAELQSNRHAFGDLKSGGGGIEPSVIRVSYLSPTAKWGLGASRAIYDPASIPPRGDEAGRCSGTGTATAAPTLTGTGASRGSRWRRRRPPMPRCPPTPSRRVTQVSPGSWKRPPRGAQDLPGGGRHQSRRPSVGRSVNHQSRHQSAGGLDQAPLRPRAISRHGAPRPRKRQLTS